MDDEFTRRCNLRIENLELVKKRCRLEKDMIGYYSISGEINGIIYTRDMYIRLLELNADIANFNIK